MDAYDGQTGLFRFTSPVASPGTGQSNPTAQPAAVVSVGSAAVTEVLNADASRTYDITSTLNAFLATRPQAASTQVPLVVTSAGKGGITIYPPRIVYDPS